MDIVQDGRAISSTISYQGNDTGGENVFSFNGLVTENRFHFLPERWIKQGNGNQCMAGGFASVIQVSGGWGIRGDLAGASKVRGGCHRASGSMYLSVAGDE